MLEVQITPEHTEKMLYENAMSFAEVKEFLKDATDLGNDEEDIHFQVGALLLLGLARPKRVKDLVALTKYDKEFVAMISENLHRAGIWVAEDTATFANWGHSPVQFMIDILIGLGTFELVSEPTLN